MRLDPEKLELLVLARLAAKTKKPPAVSERSSYRYAHQKGVSLFFERGAKNIFIILRSTNGETDQVNL